MLCRYRFNASISIETFANWTITNNRFTELVFASTNPVIAADPKTLADTEVGVVADEYTAIRCTDLSARFHTPVSLSCWRTRWAR